MTRRHVWKEGETNGDCWKAEESVLFFHLYTCHYHQFSE